MPGSKEKRLAKCTSGHKEMKIFYFWMSQNEHHKNHRRHNQIQYTWKRTSTKFLVKTSLKRPKYKHINSINSKKFWYQKPQNWQRMLSKSSHHTEMYHPKDHHTNALKLEYERTSTIFCEEVKKLPKHYRVSPLPGPPSRLNPVILCREARKNG